jgi:hypothetical protein
MAVEIPDVPRLPAVNASNQPAEAFTDEHLAVVHAIDALASSVHFKQKSAALTEKKSKTPLLFQSVPLWAAVMERVCVGRFTLQARRLIHSLFIHTICDDVALAILDKR